MSRCILAAGAHNGHGYSFHRVGGRKVYRHREAYEAIHGPMPAGLEIDHLCRNPRCVNPDHLEAVTHRENMLRSPYIAAKVAQTHCVHGHPFDEANTARMRDGTRQCRACLAARYRARKEAARAAA